MLLELIQKDPCPHKDRSRSRPAAHKGKMDHTIPWGTFLPTV